MAKSKVKRYGTGGGTDPYEDVKTSGISDEDASDYGSKMGRGAPGTSETMMDESKGEAILKAMRDTAASPRAAAAKPKVSTSVAAEKPAAPAVKEATKTEVVTKPATSAKKETYVDMSGKVQTKKSAAERDADMAARRESFVSGIKNIGSSIGDIFSKARQNYESTRPVSRQVQKERESAMSRGNLAKGGMTSSASKRADGIATKGKTRGKMC